LETDRGAVLTIRAASRGLIDFQRANVKDINWWRYVNAILYASLRDESLVTDQLAYQYQLALISNSTLTQDSWKGAQEQAKAMFQDCLNTQRPWAARTSAQRQEEQVGGLVDTYRKTIGDPRDPVFAAKLEQDIRDSQARRRERRNNQETEDSRLTRLLRERDNKVRKTKG